MMGFFVSPVYFKVNTSDVSNEKKQEARSDALWSWVMISQAAANAGEQDAYNNALEQMQKITEHASIADALSKGLLRTAASNDYPAWAIAIVRLAAQTMGDEVRFKELAPSLDVAISSAKAENKTQETLLAQVNAQLAIERENLIAQCPSLVNRM